MRGQQFPVTFGVIPVDIRLEQDALFVPDAPKVDVDDVDIAMVLSDGPAAVNRNGRLHRLFSASSMRSRM
jgi:hypothetical protein